MEEKRDKDATRVDVDLPDGGCGECEEFENSLPTMTGPYGPPLAIGPDGTDPYATGICALSGHQCSEDSPACVLKEEPEEG